MNRDAIIKTLKDAEGALRARGVNHAALFGSVARGDDGLKSDIDILVDLDANVVRTIYDDAGVMHYIADILSGDVDVVDRAALKTHVRPSAAADAIYAF